MKREKVIRILKFCKGIDREIAYNKLRIKELQERLNNAGRSVSFVKMSGNKYNASDPTAALVLNSEYIKELCEKNDLLNNLKIEISQEVDKLNIVQKTIIYDFYIKGFPWAKIYTKIHYSDTQAKTHRKAGLEILGEYFEKNESITNFNYPK
ncbi:MAG: hypothetical protein FWH05_08640 [Oscillospiraceae bacterium]|nr:hypothetical protein [Oscillospiraceae bacterium]